MKRIPLLLSITLAVGTAFVLETGDAHPGRHVGAKQIDVDGNGAISLEEFIAARSERATRRFLRRDRDGDGLITADDFGDRPQPPDIDRDAIRACLEDALGVELPDRPEPGERFDEADLDGDGALSLDEALIAAETAAVARFERLDNDGDGLLQREEVRAAFARVREIRQARRQCREAQQDLAAVLEG